MTEGLLAQDINNHKSCIDQIFPERKCYQLRCRHKDLTRNCNNPYNTYKPYQEFDNHFCGLFSFSICFESFQFRNKSSQ